MTQCKYLFEACFTENQPIFFKNDSLGPDLEIGRFTGILIFYYKTFRENTSEKLKPGRKPGYKGKLRSGLRSQGNYKIEEGYSRETSSWSCKVHIT